MKIKFKKDTWCLQQVGGGFAGIYNTKAILIKPKEFKIISIDKEGKRYSRIWVWSDNNMDGNNILLLKNKTLGCFCSPLACHGDFLKELANST